MARCPEPCGKVRFAVEHTAQLACIQAAMDGRPNLTWYWADDCHYWHLTTTTGGRRKWRRGQWIRGFAPDQDAA